MLNRPKPSRVVLLTFGKQVIPHGGQNYLNNIPVLFETLEPLNPDRFCIPKAFNAPIIRNIFIWSEYCIPIGWSALRKIGGTWQPGLALWHQQHIQSAMTNSNSPMKHS